MKLILHIGTEKTGTTSLQEWMGKNRAALDARGVFYPKSLGDKRHVDISVFALGVYEKGHIALGMRNIENQRSLEAYRAKVRRRFNIEMKQAASSGKYHSCVISDEGLQILLRKPAELIRLQRLFAPYADDIEVVVAVRPQVDYAVSLVSTLMRLGLRIGAAWFNNVTPQNPRFEYNRLVELWEGVFGASNVRVVPYKRNPSTIDLFAGFLDLDPSEFASIPRQNSFVDWRTLRVMNSLDNEKLKKFRHLVDGLGAKEPLQIGPKLAQNIVDRFAESNALLVARRPELTAEDLLPDPKRYEAAENLSLINKKFPADKLPLAVFNALFR